MHNTTESLLLEQITLITHPLKGYTPNFNINPSNKNNINSSLSIPTSNKEDAILKTMT